MSIKAQSISYVKSHLAQVISDLHDGSGPLIVTQNGATAAVIQDPESYERTQQAMAVLKLVALADEDVRHGRVHTHDEVFAAARKRLTTRRKIAR